ncbi:MAG: DUF4915 domain-containing protein [Solirubrobacteraceae bacterium]
MDPIHSIVVSGLDDTRGIGGVFAIEDRSARLVDDIPTTGLEFDERAGGWIRAVHPVFSPAVDGALMSYDSRGNARLRRLSVARDLHDVQIVGGEALFVASYENAVFMLRRFGAPLRRWQLPGEPDAWHLNCVTGHEGEVFASAFCDGRSHRGWVSRHAGEGIVFSLTTGRVLANGLDMPHSPLFIDGMLLVCNSGANELVAIDPAEPTRRVRTIGLGGFTRGLAVFGTCILVGVSARRGAPELADPVASVIVLDRRSWRIIDRIDVPVPEVYDVRVVPRPAVAVLDNGADQARYLLTSAGAGSRGARPVPGYPTPRQSASGPCAVLEPGDGCVEVRARMPRRVSAGSLAEISVILTNGSGRLYPVGVGDDHPVHMSYRWTSESGKHITPDHEPLRTLLPEDFLPGADLPAILLVRAPTIAGIYRLRITLVQEQVFWFDDANPAMAANGSLVVVLAGAPVRGALKRIAVSLLDWAARRARYNAVCRGERS